jgi:hypothetical protein
LDEELLLVHTPEYLRALRSPNGISRFEPLNPRNTCERRVRLINTVLFPLPAKRGEG